MANTYSWTIDSLYSAPSLNGQTDVVTIANWIVTGSDGVNTSVVKGSQPLTYAAGTPFTPYSNIAEATVIGWVQEAMGAAGVTQVQNQLDTQIENIVNKKNNDLLVQNPLPWVKA
jgi:hypothetical protein